MLRFAEHNIKRSSFINTNNDNIFKGKFDNKHKPS